MRIYRTLDLSPKTHTYVAVKMATGTKVHLRMEGSTHTICNKFSVQTEQHETADKVITCTHCITNMDAHSDAITQGFTTEAK